MSPRGTKILQRKLNSYCLIQTNNNYTILSYCQEYHYRSHTLKYPNILVLYRPPPTFQMQLFYHFRVVKGLDTFFHRWTTDSDNDFRFQAPNQRGEGGCLHVVVIPA